MAALARDLVERRSDEAVSTVDVGALIGVLETWWSVRTTEKTRPAVDGPELVCATRGRARSFDRQA